MIFDYYESFFIIKVYLVCYYNEVKVKGKVFYGQEPRPSTAPGLGADQAETD